MLSKKALFSLIPLALIILVASVFRFVYLNEVPSSIGGDEIVYIVNAKASFLTGHDIFGTWNPIQGLLFKYPRGETQAELPYILNSFSVGPLPFSLFAARLPNAIMGILIVLFIYLCAAELFDKKTALFAAAVASINPWLIYIGRTAYEATPAMLFFLIAFYILLKAKGWWIVSSFIFLAAAFYSYIGTKLFFIPFVLAVLTYCYFFLNNKKYLKQYLTVLILCFGLILFFVVSLKLNPATARLGELLTPNSPGISDQVDLLRKTSIANPLLNLMVNKYTVTLNILATKTLKTFASDFLFVNGDEFFSLYRHGMFYYIDSLFLLFGTIFVFIKKRSLFFLFIALLVFGTIPQVFHTPDISNFSIHATMTYLFMIFLIGLGINGVIDFFKNKNIKLTSGVVILVIYILSALNFANIYFYYFPLQGYFDFPLRIVANEAYRNSSLQKVIVYSNTSFDIYKKYIFYTNQYNKQTAPIIEKNLNSSNYTLGNVTFKSCNTPDLKDKNTVTIIDDKCSESNIKSDHLSIAQLKDGGEVWKVFNDKVCLGASLNRYAQGLTLNDFNIEKLSNKDFCHGFITSL